MQGALLLPAQPLLDGRQTAQGGSRGCATPQALDLPPAPRVQRWIGNATWADVAIIWARNSETNQVNAFIVRKGNPGYRWAHWSGSSFEREVTRPVAFRRVCMACTVPCPLLTNLVLFHQPQLPPTLPPPGLLGSAKKM